MKKLKSAETSKNEQTSGVIFAGARSAPGFFKEYAIGHAARQVCDWAAATTKKLYRRATATSGNVFLNSITRILT